MRHLSRTIFYLASFGLARGGLFVAPIVLANLLAPADYGALELAQALASVGATILALGTSAAVPLVLVRKVTTASWGGVLLHQAGSVALLVGLALAAVVAGAPSVIWLTALCIGTLMLQVLWSVTLKSQGRGEASLLIDAGFWGVVALAVLMAYGLTVPVIERATLALGALTLYLGALACWTVWRLAQAGPGRTFSMYISTVRTGFPLMTVTLLALLATTSGRLGIGLLSTPEIMADYAVLFRATALPIVAHQVVVVARFRQIFELSPPELERRLPVVVGLVGASVVVFWLLPVVATQITGSGVPWVNAQGVSGLNVPVNDAAALAAACNQILSSDGLRLELATGARMRFEREFTEQVSINRMLAVYGSLLNKGEAA